VAEPARFIGGLNIAGRFGRLNATWPLAELVLGDDGLRLGLRGPLRLVSRDRAADYSELDGVQAVVGPMGSSGVRFRVRGAGTWYFWTTHADAVVATVGKSGVPVVGGRPKLPLLYSKDWQ
jgi:hypothetical protein